MLLIEAGGEGRGFADDGAEDWRDCWPVLEGGGGKVVFNAVRGGGFFWAEAVVMVWLREHSSVLI